MHLVDEFERRLKENGVVDIGYSYIPDAPGKLDRAVSIVIPLSDAVIDELDMAPTHAYFHHYRTVNALIDRIVLQAGLLLQQNGWRYMPIAASQTIYSGGQGGKPGNRDHQGLYSHKKAAVLAGLGTIGKSALFLHRTYGPRVRLGTLLTDCPLPVVESTQASLCESCTSCVDACPAGAIKGASWRPGQPREELIDADGCNRYMRSHFMNIGRGAVCGICIKACPHGVQPQANFSEGRA